MDLDKLQSNLKRININKLIVVILQRPEIEKRIIKAAQNRLYLEGTDLNGNSLQTDKAFEQRKFESYSEYTKKLKKDKGQKTSNVTLKDSGEFYNSMELKTIGEGEFQIVGDLDTKNIFDNFTHLFTNKILFEKNVLFLSNEQKKELTKEIYKLCVIAINEILTKS